MNRTDNQRLGDISFQLSNLVDELRIIREILYANNSEYHVSQEEFNTRIAKKLVRKK